MTELFSSTLGLSETVRNPRLLITEGASMLEAT